MTRLRTLADLPHSIFACKRLIRDFQPGVVFGVGGYASGPAMAAALWLKVPAMAFEPNAMPGLANRLVGKKVQAAAVNFPSAAKWFHNCEVTGIPVRPEFFNLEPPPGGPPHLLVFGGSQGARIFNTHLPRIIVGLLDAVPGLTVLHQSGMRHAESTQAAYVGQRSRPRRWQVQSFLRRYAGPLCPGAPGDGAQRRIHGGGTGCRRQAQPAGALCRRRRRASEAQRRGHGGCRSSRNVAGRGFGCSGSAAHNAG